MAMGSNGTFGGFFMGAGLMMAGSLQMMFCGELIMFRRLLMIFNSFLRFEMSHIGLVGFRRISGLSSRFCIYHLFSIYTASIFSRCSKGEKFNRRLCYI